MLIPSLIITAIPSDAAWVQSIYRWIDGNLGGGTGGVSWWYILILFALIIFFTYFYTAIQFDPEKQAEMIQRQGGFVPGVRPGRQTARHLAFILNRITLARIHLPGADRHPPRHRRGGLGVNIAFSGVSILIVVGVALETMKQIESQLTMRNYEGILTVRIPSWYLGIGTLSRTTIPAHQDLVLTLLLSDRLAPARAPRRPGWRSVSASPTSPPETCSVITSRPEPSSAGWSTRS